MKKFLAVLLISTWTLGAMAMAADSIQPSQGLSARPAQMAGKKHKKKKKGHGKKKRKADAVQSEPINEPAGNAAPAVPVDNAPPAH